MSEQQAEDEFKTKWQSRKLELLAENSTNKEIDIPLSNEIDKIVNSEENGIVVNQLKHQLTQEDLNRLDWEASDSSAWLNDQVINMYMEMLNKRSRQNPDLPKIYASNTYLMENFERYNYDYDKVKHWTTKAGIKLYKLDKFFIPINEGKHWTLMIIHNDEKIIEWYDSLPNRVEKKQPEGEKFKFFRWAQSYLLDEYIKENNEPMDETGWRFEKTTEPHQQNLIDCGVFVCTYADLTASGWPNCWFKQQHMPLMRKKMLHEFLSGKMYLNRTHQEFSQPISETIYDKENNVKIVINLT